MDSARRARLSLSATTLEPPPPPGCLHVSQEQGPVALLTGGARSLVPQPHLLFNGPPSANVTHTCGRFTLPLRGHLETGAAVRLPHGGPVTWLSFKNAKVC